MWLMVLCGLSYGGKVVLYDGSPLTPDPLVTLRMVEKLKSGSSILWDYSCLLMISELHFLAPRPDSYQIL